MGRSYSRNVFVRNITLATIPVAVSVVGATLVERARIVPFGLVVLAAAVLGAWWMTHRSMAPIRRLAAFAARIGAPARRRGRRPEDEFEVLSRTLIEMGVKMKESHETLKLRDSRLEESEERALRSQPHAFHPNPIRHH